ncbi:MAG: 3,4-dihydroxy-2-butanone-4-phosphate synthase [Rickettsiaceae bacterium H1]|nr:3,4-dihydroxy-2-butanone-4-phosphate synthase [Rickettsiaceae bacterium H1]
MIAGVEQIIANAKIGKKFILVDEASRENEGDLVVAAELITPDIINFMITYGKGCICLTMTEKLRRKLGLDLLPKRNNRKYATNFATPFDASEVKTGISAHERAKSIKVALSGDKDLIATPGHILPLVAENEGLKIRKGHTEGSVEIMKLAGFNEPSAVICEIIKEDGTMARMPDLEKFAMKHDINILEMTSLSEYLNGL